MKGTERSVMKIPYDTGRRENLIGLVLWGVFIFVYYYVITKLFQRPFFPNIFGPSYSLLYDLGTLCIILVSVTGALLTARLLFHTYLSLKAYHIHEGSGWQNWRSRKEKRTDTDADRT